MSSLPMIGIDLVALAILTLALYFPRHRRADLLVAFIGVNVGVLAVAIVLATSTVGMGLGLGLFGVLSIIRLRSTEISQSEVAYYFAALAIGLICGLAAMNPAIMLETTLLSALILGALAIGDSRLLLGRYRTEQIQLDRALTTDAARRAYCEELVGAPVSQVHVIKLDLVNDLTLVEVRYRTSKTAASAPAATASPARSSATPSATSSASAIGATR